MRMKSTVHRLFGGTGTEWYVKQNTLHSILPLKMFVTQIRYFTKSNTNNQQGRSSSIGAKILSFVFRQLTEDFKEENTEKESVQYRIPISYSPE